MKRGKIVQTGILLLAQLTFGTLAVAGGVTNAIDRSAPDFVKAHLLVIDPGGELYSCAGHAALRLKCEAYQLDFCYSYESETVSERVLTFLSGRLKMGMFAIPTDTYLSLFRKERRCVRQYPLNLPIEVKTRLCKVMDDKVKEGVSLPYDFLKRGCAQSVLTCLLEAVQPLQVDFGQWPLRLTEKSRRELFYDSLDDFPWNRFFAMSLVGSEADVLLPSYQRVVIPSDLLFMLRQAKVAGTPIIADEGKELTPRHPVNAPFWFSPCVASGILLVLALMSRLKGIGLGCRGILYVVYIICAIFYTYIVFFTDLPGTSWHWLAVPFNVLPIVFWKWREKWRLWFGVLLIIWMMGMLLSPHRLIDPAYYAVVSAYALLCMGIPRTR